MYHVSCLFSLWFHVFLNHSSSFLHVFVSFVSFQVIRGQWSESRRKRSKIARKIVFPVQISRDQHNLVISHDTDYVGPFESRAFNQPEDDTTNPCCLTLPMSTLGQLQNFWSFDGFCDLLTSVTSIFLWLVISVH